MRSWNYWRAANDRPYISHHKEFFLRCGLDAIFGEGQHGLRMVVGAQEEAGGLGLCRQERIGVLDADLVLGTDAHDLRQSAGAVGQRDRCDLGGTGNRAEALSKRQKVLGPATQVLYQ